MKVWVLQLQGQFAVSTPFAWTIRARCLTEEKAAQPEGEVLFPHTLWPMDKESRRQGVPFLGSGQRFQQRSVATVRMKAHGDRLFSHRRGSIA